VVGGAGGGGGGGNGGWGGIAGNSSAGAHAHGAGGGGGGGYGGGVLTLIADAIVYEAGNPPGFYVSGQQGGLAGPHATDPGLPGQDGQGGVIVIQARSYASRTAHWDLGTTLEGDKALPGGHYVITGGPQKVFRLETTPPSVTIVTPKTGQKMNSEVIAAQGTAADNTRVASVWCQINEGAWNKADGTTTWKAQLPLRPGANLLRAYSVDEFGNRSITNSVKLNYVVSAPLGVQISGSGTVAPYTNGTLLPVDIRYTITAKPGTGYVFSNWVCEVSGYKVITNHPCLAFTMVSNLCLRAQFIPNPFVPLKGTYNGLVYDTNAVAPQNSGYITLTTTEKGAFSGRLILGGVTKSLSGRFDVSKRAQMMISRNGLTPLQVQLGIPGSDCLTGTVTDGNWTAHILANRAVFSLTGACPYAGKYTVALPAEGMGCGFGTIAVDQKGIVKFSGALPDGTAIALTTAVSASGEWPFYVGLSGGQTSAGSWMNFTNTSEADLVGDFYWFKAAVPTAKYYPLGLTNATVAIGNRYITAPGSQVLNWTNGEIAFSGGNLSQTLTNHVFLTNGSKVLNTSSNKLVMTISSAGLFKGSVYAPQTRRTYPFQGVLLQKLNAGYGYCLGTNKSGMVELRSH
jgi:hypothetical protein